MFLPPAVTMMSFLRSVIVTKPSLVDRRDVAGAQPAVVVEHLRRRLRVLVVAREDRLAADQELAVVGEPAARCPAAHARPCRSGNASQRVRRARRSCTRSGRSPRGCRCRSRGRTPRSPSRAARRPRSASRRRPPSRSFTFEKTSRSASRCCAASAGGSRRPCLPQRAHAPADVERPVDQPPLDAGRLVERRRDRGVDLLVHARHARQDRRPHLRQRVRRRASGSGRNAIV